MEWVRGEDIWQLMFSHKEEQTKPTLVYQLKERLKNNCLNTYLAQALTEEMGELYLNFRARYNFNLQIRVLWTMWK